MTFESAVRYWWTVAWLFALFGAKPVQANFEELVGDLPRTILAQKGPYLVTSDIYVPAGRTVTIEAGTVFLFKNFTGLHVQGTLMANGTADHPVVFTSENDKRFNTTTTLIANPYDWNGIFIHEDAIGTDLQHIDVDFSVYGINSLTKFIRITDAVFTENGRANLTIEGQPQPVTAAPFSFSLSVENESINGVPVKILRDPEAPKRTVLRYAGLSVFVSGIVAGAVFTTQCHTAQQRMDNVAGNHYNVNGTSDFNSAQADRNRNAVLLAAGYFVGLIGACGFTYSFYF